MTKAWKELWKPLAAIVIFILALRFIHGELRSLSVQQVLRNLELVPGSRIGLAVLLTGACFLVLSTYDLLGNRYIGSTLSRSRIGLASFVGYAFSNALGFPLFTGAPIRFRLYTGWGLSAVDVTRIVGFCMLTFWIGFLSLSGGVLLLGSSTVLERVDLPVLVARSVGLVSLLVVLAYLSWVVVFRRPLRIRSFEFPAPPRRFVAAQVVVGALDWAVAASVLYVLLPVGHGIPFIPFLAVFLLAQITGLLSLVPGGLGVFEAVVLALMPGSIDESALLASFVVYRLVYYLLPLVLAALTVAAYEARYRREAIERVVGAFGRGVSSVVPMVLSALVLAGGMLLLFSGSIPAPAGRLGLLDRFLPLGLIELSHFLGSVAGAGLLILAWGLRRRLDAAYTVTLALLALGLAASVVRGLGMLPSATLGVALVALLPARREFFRKAQLTSEPLSAEWIAMVGLVLVATAWLALFAFKDVTYSGELWWRFAAAGDAPRALRALVGAAAVIFVFGSMRLLRPVTPDDPPADPGLVPVEVSEIGAAAPRASSHLALLGDKHVLLSRSGEAFLMYGIEGRSWISMGDPVGNPDDFEELVWRFRKTVFRHGGWPVFYQVSPEHLPLYLDAGLSLLKLGEEGRVRLADFSLEGSSRSGFRQTIRRVEKEGGSFEWIEREAVPAVLPELRAVSDAWLAEKKAGEKGFSMGFFVERYVERVPVGVVRKEGAIVAFADVWAAGGLEEVSPDLMRYAASAPKGSMEYLFVQLMLLAKERGYRWFGLGMAPLSGLDTKPLAPLWAKLGAAVFRYGEHFYNFQGLRGYKEKFDPVWEPRYLASPGGLALPRILTNVSTLIAGGVRGLVKS